MLKDSKAVWSDLINQTKCVTPVLATKFISFRQQCKVFVWCIHISTRLQTVDKWILPRQNTDESSSPYPLHVVIVSRNVKHGTQSVHSFNWRNATPIDPTLHIFRIGVVQLYGESLLQKQTTTKNTNNNYAVKYKFKFNNSLKLTRGIYIVHH